MTLKDTTDFVVSVNPTGVVMWYVSAPAKRNLRQFYRGSEFQQSAYEDQENAIPRVFLWPPADWTPIVLSEVARHEVITYKTIKNSKDLT